jgi:hypothetical protein
LLVSEHGGSLILRNNMIDLNRIRSIKTLEGMKKDLEFFIKESEVSKDIYRTEYDWDTEDYEADKEEAIYLLESIDIRIKSLSKMKVNPPKEKPAKPRCKKSDSEEIVCGERVFAERDCDPYTTDDTGHSEDVQPQ